MQCLFATTYMSAEHAPKATNLPFGVTGSSPVLTAAEKTISLSVTRYPNESAAKNAINQTTIWGALITSGTSNTLIVVPSISDLAPLDLAVRFLPPRNAYILLHHTIYFNGHGTTQALTVLLIYLVAGAVILGVLDWFRSEPPVPADVTEAAAMAVPIGATP